MIMFWLKGVGFMGWIYLIKCVVSVFCEFEYEKGYVNV